MPRSCTVCAHPESFAINEAMVLHGQSNRSIAKQFGVSDAAVQRHKEHIPELLVEASGAQEVADADALLDEMRRIRDDLRRLCEKAEREDDYRTAIGGQAALLKYADLLARVLKIISDGPQINIASSPQWVELRTVILVALEGHSEARDAVVRALEGVDGRAR